MTPEEAAMHFYEDRAVVAPHVTDRYVGRVLAKAWAEACNTLAAREATHATTIERLAKAEAALLSCQMDMRALEHERVVLTKQLEAVLSTVDELQDVLRKLYRELDP